MHVFVFKSLFVTSTSLTVENSYFPLLCSFALSECVIYSEPLLTGYKCLLIQRGDLMVAWLFVNPIQPKDATWRPFSRQMVLHVDTDPSISVSFNILYICNTLSKNVFIPEVIISFFSPWNVCTLTYGTTEVS